MAGRVRRELTRTQVIDAALAVLDEAGARACTLRAVAVTLHVTPMAIYWHVSDKEDLLDAVLDRVLSSISPAGLPADPLQALAVMGRRYREAFLAHPNAAQLLAARPMPEGDAARGLLAGTAALLQAAGLTGQELACATMLLTEFAMGSVLLEHGLREADDVSAVTGIDPPDAATRFEFGITVLLEGIRARRPVPPPDSDR